MESRLNLNWGPIMKSINDDPHDFFLQGGWQVIGGGPGASNAVRTPNMPCLCCVVNRILKNSESESESESDFVADNDFSEESSNSDAAESVYDGSDASDDDGSSGMDDESEGIY